jgi:hypothetical protein
MINKTILLIALWLFFFSGAALAFDHQHSLWNQLLQQNVHWDSKGVASSVDYAAFKRQEAALDNYLAELSAVPLKNYQGWQKPQQLAFLLNAYNAFTVKLILSEYPDLESIKDLGSFFSSPWKRKFFSLLGKKRHLDEIEHGMIREPGAFDEPRIHAAVVCASIGCPGIRDEAFVATNLDAQLEDSLRRFLSDRNRNRYNAQADQLEVSKIFDWYGDDFIDYRGYPSVAAFLGSYAELLSDDLQAQLRLKAGDTPVGFLDYDWRLNDYRQ